MPIFEIFEKFGLKLLPEPTNSNYSMINTGGVEVEVGEFLYGFIRMIKPEVILETGTHLGVSAASMALALKDNNRGKITTVEYEPTHYHNANTMFRDMGLKDWINSVLIDSALIQVTDNQYDFIFLDTEPNLRFNELVRFWHGLKPGGFIGIHDLHEGMGQTGQTINGMLDWPFGTMPDEMKRILKEEVQSFHFYTPRGFFLGQKKKAGMYQI